MPDKPLQPTPAELLEAKRAPDLVEVPARWVLALTGEGPPEEPGFARAVGALFGVSYTLRFARKKSGLPDFKVGVLEGEWWAEGGDLPVHEVPARKTWRWRLRMSVPDDVSELELQQAVEAATTRRKGKLEGSKEARSIELVHLPKERCARILHLGPYATEPESLAKIDELLTTRGLERELRHVEVYLSDPSRTAPEKLETVLLTRIV